MTNNEFKAWFEGFSEGIDKTPSAKQWAKIQEKIGQIDGTLAFTQYVTRYVDRPYFPTSLYGSITSTSGYAQAIPMNLQNAVVQNQSQTASSLIAAIGRSDAAAIG